MARLLMQCLGQAGHSVEVASSLRSFLRDPKDAAGHAAIMTQAEQERARLTGLWTRDGPPALWFCYHPYYKAPDLIGPSLCAAFDVPYVTAEASYSARRNRGLWVPFQAQVLDCIHQAAVNICMTERDHAGLLQAAPTARFARLPPFIDTGVFTAQEPTPSPAHLITVAMMRAGDKMDSYTRLAAALRRVERDDWHLSVVGDGALRVEVQALFSEFPPDRITWHGQLTSTDIAALFAQSALYLWPGCGEAYGLAYLEAQAAGLPVVAYDTAGVPEVIADGITGLLTPFGDDRAYADAICFVLNNEGDRRRMAQAAAERVRQTHSMPAAVAKLSGILRPILAGTS